MPCWLNGRVIGTIVAVPTTVGLYERQGTEVEVEVRLKPGVTPESILDPELGIGPPPPPRDNRPTAWERILWDADF
jgi:hypothetical protein